MFFSYQCGSLVEDFLLVDVGERVGEGRQERRRREFQAEHDGLRIGRSRPCRPSRKTPADALVTPCGGLTIICQLRRHRRGQRRAVGEFHPVADVEGVGLAVIGRLRDFGAQIAHEIGRRGRVLRVDPDQHAVERRDRMHCRVGRFAVPVEARRRVGRDQVGQRAAAFRLLVRRGSGRGSKQQHPAGRRQSRWNRIRYLPQQPFRPLFVEPDLARSWLMKWLGAIFSPFTYER